MQSNWNAYTVTTAWYDAGQREAAWIAPANQNFADKLDDKWIQLLMNMYLL